MTHGAVCPIDVVKTRMQLDPITYNKGMVSAFRQVVAAEGASVLATGLGATAAGYFVQGMSELYRVYNLCIRLIVARD